MIISHRRKFIFVHIPKTAGTSVTSALSEYADKHEPMPSLHAKAREIRDTMGTKIWDEYFTFSFVRNPWDLMVSSYHWWLQFASVFAPERYANDIEEVHSLPNFEAFLRSEYGNSRIAQFEGDFKDWLKDDDGQTLVKYVGRFETIDRDLRTICSQIGCPTPILSRRRVSWHKHYSSYYTPNTVELVAHRFREDIQRYNYRFETPPPLYDLLHYHLPEMKRRVPWIRSVNWSGLRKRMKLFVGKSHRAP